MNDKIKPIRILQVCQRMEAAGVQSFLMNMYRNINREKVQFDFLVHYKEKQFFDEEIEKLGGHVYKLSVREDFNFLKYIRELDKFFNEHKEYHVIHGHMDTLGAIYLGRAEKCGVPVRIAHSHTDYVQNGFKKMIRLFMISNYKNHASHLFACSEQSGRFMFGNNKFDIIRNGIDVTRFKYNFKMREYKRKELGIKENVVIGNVGRFHMVKNQLFLLDIVKEISHRIPDIVLLLIGDGALENEIVSKVRDLKIEHNVRILSNRHDINELYQAMDIFVLPSLFEGISVAGIEAQTSGLPCVFSNKINAKSDITGNVWFESLDNNAKEWSLLIINIISSFKRKDVSDKVILSGYSAQEEAKKLEAFYLRVHNNSCR